MFYKIVAAGQAPLASVAAFARNRAGATAMEYGLIGAGIALTLVAASFALGDELVGLFGDIQDSFSERRP